MQRLIRGACAKTGRDHHPRRAGATRLSVEFAHRAPRPLRSFRRCQEQLTAAGLIGDWREPRSVLRLAPIPLYNSFLTDVLAAVDLLARALRGSPLWIRIVGAGPTGALLAVLLARRGFKIELYESRSDPRSVPAASGRSINLALADRGIHALKAAGVFGALGSALLPMRGRLIHYQNGDTAFQPYGQRPNEVIYSVSHGIVSTKR